MHTLEYAKTTFNFNSDLSGDVRIVTANGGEIEVPGYDLVCFVAEYVRRQRIYEIESMHVHEVLNVRPL